MNLTMTKSNDSYLFRFLSPLIRGGAFLIVLLVGYFQTVDSYQTQKWKVFGFGVALGAIFSLGIVLSTVPIGKRFKVLVSIAILLSALARSVLLIPPPINIFVLLIDIGAIWNLLSRRTP